MPEQWSGAVWDGTPPNAHRDGWHLVELWRVWHEQFNGTAPRVEVLLEEDSVKQVWFWTAAKQSWDVDEESITPAEQAVDYRYIGEMALITLHEPQVVTTAYEKLWDFVANVAGTPQEGDDYEGYKQQWDEEGLRTRLLEDLQPKAVQLLS